MFGTCGIGFYVVAFYLDAMELSTANAMVSNFGLISFFVEGITGYEVQANAYPKLEPSLELVDPS